jgi:hypothetical protein
MHLSHLGSSCFGAINWSYSVTRVHESSSRARVKQQRQATNDTRATTMALCSNASLSVGNCLLLEQSGQHEPAQTHGKSTKNRKTEKPIAGFLIASRANMPDSSRTP